MKWLRKTASRNVAVTLSYCYARKSCMLGTDYRIIVYLETEPFTTQVLYKKLGLARLILNMVAPPQHEIISCMGAPRMELGPSVYPSSSFPYFAPTNEAL